MSIITEPISIVKIDQKDVTQDVLSGSITHNANAIDSYNITLDNSANKYDRYFDVSLRIIEIWLGGDNVGIEKVFRGFVEMPIPTRIADTDVYVLSQLATSACLNFQEVPESKGAYSAKTAAYMVEDIFDNYVELLLKGKILSSATTHNYDPTNKRPLTIIQELCTIDDCYFFVDPYDRFSFDQNDNMTKLKLKSDDLVIKLLRPVVDLSQIINFFTFKGDPDVPIKVTSEDAVSQAIYYKRYASEQDKNFADATLAQAYADEVIANYKDPLWRYEVDIAPILGLNVNHKLLLDDELYRIKNYLKIISITRTFTQENYSISLTLENRPRTNESILSDYKMKFEKLMKDVQL